MAASGHTSIGELARLMGVSVATIRSWEVRYGWPRHVRTRGAHRRYERSDSETFRAIAELRREFAMSEALQRVTALRARNVHESAQLANETEQNLRCRGLDS
jgi:DNA-binding transcriptional MerR regulator